MTLNRERLRARLLEELSTTRLSVASTVDNLMFILVEEHDTACPPPGMATRIVAGWGGASDDPVMVVGRRAGKSFDWATVAPEGEWYPPVEEREFEFEEETRPEGI